MTDLHTLENTASRTPKAVAAEDHDRLARHYWALASAEGDFRRRRTHLKRASAFVGHAYERGMEDPESLRLYRDVLARTAMVHSFPQDVRRILSKVTIRWLAAAGIGEPALIARGKGRVATETACVALGDVGAAPDATDDPWSEGALVAWMRAGRRLVVSTGYDGVLRGEIRILECAEPVLDLPEYRRLAASSPTIVLDVPTGRIGLADMAAMASPWRRPPSTPCLAIEVPPGRYKACIFGFSTRRSDSVVAVLCRTDSAPANDIGAVDSLFM